MVRNIPRVLSANLPAAVSTRPKNLSALLAAAVAGSPVAWFLCSSAVFAQTAPQWNLYSSTTGLVVPYRDGSLNSRNNDGTFANRPASLAIEVTGTSKSIPVTIDTGSTGVAISRALLPPGALDGRTPIGAGAINYDSSGNTPTGLFYQLPLSILGGNVNSQAAVGTTSVKVLVVENDNSTAYFGIGNNRNNVYSGVYNPSLSFQQNVAQGNITQISAVGMNPLINVAVSGTPLPNQGYVVMNNQIVVGLTTANNSYSLVKLTPDPAAGPMLWQGIPVALSSGTGNPFVSGTMLPDTGIANAYLKPFVTAGGTVDVSLPGMPQQGAFYSFVVPAQGTACGTLTAMTPCEVLGSPSAEPFINTGRQFYSGFNYLFDPVNGYVGYALSSSGLTNQATITPLLALQGTVALPNNFISSLPVALFAPTTLTTGGAAAFNAAFMGYGNNLTLSGGGAYAFNAPVSLGAGAFGLQQGAAAINAGLSAASVSVGAQGAMSNNAGSTITGNVFNAGALNNSVGGTIVGAMANVGAFNNNGVVSGSVSNQGILAGTGTIVGNLSNFGTIAPGNSIGTMTIAGTYTQTSGGTYVAEVNGTGQSDRINVAGPATLGGTVDVQALPGSTFGARTTYTLLSATAGVTGTYGSVNELYPFLLSNLSYDTNNVYLTLVPGGFAAGAQTQAQYAVGRVLDANVNTASGDFATIIGTLATLPSSQVLPVMTSISGQNYSSFSSTMVQGAQLFLNNFANQTGGGGSPVSNRVALAEACETACDATYPALWGAWGGALGGLGTIGANAGTGGVTYNAGGFAAGLDRLVARGVRVGVTTGYTTGTQWTSGFSGNGTTDTFLAGLYGNYREGKVYADAVVGYAYSYNQMWRQISIPNLQQRTAQGRTGANQFYGQVEGGYRFDIGTAADAYITPFVRLQGYTGNQNGFTETGAQSLNLSVASQTTNSLRSVLGAQLGGAVNLGWREKLALQFRLGWSHEYASTARPVTATLGGAPLTPFTTYGIAPTRDGAVVGFAANTAIAEATSVYLRYEGNISGQDSAHALTAGVRMSW